MKKKFYSVSGFSLIELLIIIVVLGIMMAVAMPWMAVSLEDMWQVKTEREMEMLTKAIVGNPAMMQNGIRSDFGYVGDIGAFPPNLQALHENPGGYATWDGPYITTGFAEDTTGFKLDEWGTLYSYSGGLFITSTGSGSTIAKKIADASDDYLVNTFQGKIRDSVNSSPGVDHADSLDVEIVIPNGAGSTIIKSTHPNAGGLFAIDSLPVGMHPLRVIYTPNVDTIFRHVTILPRHKGQASYRFASAYFDSGTPGSVTLRPDGAGASTNLTNSGCANNYQCVDEVSSDGDGSRVIRALNSYARDTYSLEDPGISSGTIDSVKVFCKAKKAHAQGAIRANLYTYSTDYTSAEQNLTGSYADYSNAWITNPNTTVEWTWTEIDNLRAGLWLKGQNAGKPAYCTQVWVVVYYTD